MRVLRRFRHGEHRSKTDVGVFHDGAPLISRFREEKFGQSSLQLRPLALVHLPLEVSIVGQPGVFEQQRVELWFDRPDRDPLTI